MAQSSLGHHTTLVSLICFCLFASQVLWITAKKCFRMLFGVHFRSWHTSDIFLVLEPHFLRTAHLAWWSLHKCPIWSYVIPKGLDCHWLGYLLDWKKIDFYEIIRSFISILVNRMVLENEGEIWHQKWIKWIHRDNEEIKYLDTVISSQSLSLIQMLLWYLKGQENHLFDFDAWKLGEILFTN